MDLASETQTRHWALVRRSVLLCTGLWCVGLGIGLVAILVDADMLASTHTAALFMIIGVIVLPALTLLAVRHDTKAKSQTANTQGFDNNVFTDRLVVSHSKHDRLTKHGVHVNARSSRTDTHTKVA